MVSMKLNKLFHKLKYQNYDEKEIKNYFVTHKGEYKNKISSASSRSIITCPRLH